MDSVKQTRKLYTRPGRFIPIEGTPVSETVMKNDAEMVFIDPSMTYSTSDGKMHCKPPRIMIYNRLFRIGRWTLWFVNLRGYPLRIYTAGYKGVCWRIQLDTPLGCMAFERSDD